MACIRRPYRTQTNNDTCKTITTPCLTRLDNTPHHGNTFDTLTDPDSTTTIAVLDFNMRIFLILATLALALPDGVAFAQANGTVKQEYIDIDATVSPNVYKRRVDMWCDMSPSQITTTYGAGTTLAVRCKIASYGSGGSLTWSA